MLKALANENAEDDRATAIRDTLLITRKFLIENPSACEFTTSALGAAVGKRPQGGGSLHEHGSSACICHFLSDRTWSERKVREYLGVSEDVADHVANNGSTHPERQDKIQAHASFTRSVRETLKAVVRMNTALQNS
jgi:hypothetical protein